MLSAYPAQQNVANASINIYITRMVRWLRLRLNMLTIVAAFFEPMIECVNLGFLTALSLRYFFGIPMLTTMAVHISLWMLLDYFLLRFVQVGLYLPPTHFQTPYNTSAGSVTNLIFSFP